MMGSLNMFGFLRRLVLFALAIGPLLAAAGGAGGGEYSVPSVRIMQSHPALFGQLAGDQTVFVRLAYKSDTTVRFQIEGYAKGEKVTETRSNPKPRYPAGEGEALVWMAFDPPAVIDELKITILDDRWQPLAVKIVQAGLRWENEAPATGAARPAWVARLDNAQQILAAVPEPKPADAPKDLIPREWILPLAWAFVAAYVVLQVPMALWLTGKWRLAARVPLLATVPFFLYAIGAFSAGSNLWSLVLLLAAPFVLVYLVGLLAVRFFAFRMAAE